MAIQIETTFQLEGYIDSQIGGRSENQDSAGAIETPIGTVAVVCDGMGGMNGGKVASMLAVQTIIDDVAKAQINDDPKEVLINAFLHAQKDILSTASSDTELNGMGTTATAIIISKEYATNNNVHIINVPRNPTKLRLASATLRSDNSIFNFIYISSVQA